MSRLIVKSFFPILCKLYKSYNCAEQTGCSFFWNNMKDPRDAEVSVFEWSGTVSYTTRHETIRFPSPECRRLGEIFVRNLDDRQLSELMKYYLSSLIQDSYEFDTFTDNLQNIRRIILNAEESVYYLKSVHRNKPHVLILKYLSFELGGNRRKVEYMFSNDLQAETAMKYARHVYEHEVLKREPVNILDKFLSLDAFIFNDKKS